jgi:RNA polymerase sigma-70 factor, ECF subfamily
VRLACAGDPVAFRLLVERHQPMVRARAARVSFDPHEVDDIVQESFLQAFVALGRLRDPDRFAGWLGGIVLNVARGMRRRIPLALLAEWPERPHPASADGLTTAEDLDRAEVLQAAVAELPAGQRKAVEMFYYADLPTGQIGETRGAAKASLHKARRRLRAYITAHRPDLVPAASRRTSMTAVRIAHAEPLPGERPNGDFNFDQVVVVLADDPRGRVLPIWLAGGDADSLWRLLDRPRGQAELSALPPELTSEALTGQLLTAAGITVTGVDIDELGPAVTAARIGFTGPGGTRHVTGRLGLGLALAVASGAPVRVADAVMNQLAVPVHGGDLLGPFLPREPAPAPAHPRRRRRFEPRNLAFVDGLDRWEFGGSFRRAAQGGGRGYGDASGSHWHDYSCTAANQTAILAAAVPEPYGSAFLCQSIFADDYLTATVTFRAELRTEDVVGPAGLRLRVRTAGPPRPALGDEDERPDGDDHIVTITASHDWTRHEVSAQIPADADTIGFGITLARPGRVELRRAELTRSV